MKLTVELIPKSTWGNNVRSRKTVREWNIIGKKCFKLAKNKCEVCGDNGRNQGWAHSLECHEQWEWNEEDKIQTLVKLVSLCPECHLAKHLNNHIKDGLTNEERIKKYENYLVNINNISKFQVKKYIKQSVAQYKKRSKIKWVINIDLIKELEN